jgi:hypothetical protein
LVVISQIFWRFKTCDMLEILQVLKRFENLWYIADIFSTANQPRVFLRRLNM